MVTRRRWTGLPWRQSRAASAGLAGWADGRPAADVRRVYATVVGGGLGLAATTEVLNGKVEPFELFKRA